MRWTKPLSEAQESYLFWTGLFSLSSVLKRNVKVPAKLLGSWEIYPFLYIFFISPPGKGRKSTTQDYANDLLDEMEGVDRISSAMTEAVLIERIAAAKDCAVSIRSREFGTFYKKAGDSLIDTLTHLFDGVKHYDVQTISRGFDLTNSPCVNLHACTTPVWMAENLSESAIGGGFASRVINVYEETTRRRKLYNDDLDYPALSRLRGRLIADLANIGQITGEFSLDPDAKSFMEQWYSENAENPAIDDPKLAGYYERKPGHIHKLAMLIRIAYSDDLTLTLPDFHQAIKQLGLVEKKMLRVYQATGKNIHYGDLDDIAHYITRKGFASRVEILSRFSNVGLPEKLFELLGALVSMQKIEETVQGGKQGYKGK